MLRNDIFSVILTTVYLAVYVVLLQFTATRWIGMIMLSFAPLLVIWMVYTVIVHGKYTGPELGKDEFGYADRKKSLLGTW